MLLALLFVLQACTPAAPPTQPEGEEDGAVAEEEPAQADTGGGEAEEPAETEAPAEAEEQVLVIGTDISDTRFLDPHRQFDYSPPLTMRASYETLVTFAPGDYVNNQPLLATEWALSEDGQGWVFTLRPDVQFASGNPLTAEDVKFSFERLINLKDTPSELAKNIASVEVIDPQTVQVNMVNPDEPLLNILSAPTFVIVDSQAVIEQGGTNAADADATDAATEWLDQHGAGTGPYTLASWVRNSEIILERNPNYWQGEPAFSRVIIRHIGDSAAQLLALQNGDIDVALNLTPEQIATLEGNANVNIVEHTSLDYMYLTLTNGAELNEALSHKEARQAVGYAIDYDGIINGLLSGHAVRPPTFIPVGLSGSTVEATEEFGFHEDLDRARELLAEAGYPDGFEFDLAFANAAIAGTNYQLVAEKVQSDLARVGIQANLKPMDLTTMVTAYRAAELQSVITFWNPDAPEPYLWAEASVARVADRVRWEVPQELVDLVHEAGGSKDPEEQASLYIEYEKALVDNASYIILLQPVYRVAVSADITGYESTAAGWYVDMFNLQPAN
jgi:peptide/nickel transport system substrate-binding protein